MATLAQGEETKVYNYRQAAGFRARLSVNFGHSPLVEHERIVR